MLAAHKAEHMDIATHVCPGHAITSSDPPYHLNLDALNFAALDLLVGFTGKVSELTFVCIVLALNLEMGVPQFSHPLPPQTVVIFHSA